MPEPIAVTRPKQLIVEGRDPEEFFKALLREMGLTQEVQVQNFGGVSELARFLQEFQDFLEAIRTAPGSEGYLVQEIVSLGVVCDAERFRSPTDAFKSVCGALCGAGLTAPSQIETFGGSGPKVGVLILPDAATRGMLENLCLRSVENDPVMQCVDEYFKCVERRLPQTELPRIIEKARVQAFLASRPEHVAHLGLAAHKGYWSWESPAFNHVKQFLREL
jgi:hypothetical protein